MSLSRRTLECMLFLCPLCARIVIGPLVAGAAVAMRKSTTVYSTTEAQRNRRTGALVAATTARMRGRACVLSPAGFPGRRFIQRRDGGWSFALSLLWGVFQQRKRQHQTRRRAVLKRTQEPWRRVEINAGLYNKLSMKEARTAACFWAALCAAVWALVNLEFLGGEGATRRE